MADGLVDRLHWVFSVGLERKEKGPPGTVGQAGLLPHL